MRFRNGYHGNVTQRLFSSLSCLVYAYNAKCKMQRPAQPNYGDKLHSSAYPSFLIEGKSLLQTIYSQSPNVPVYPGNIVNVEGDTVNIILSEKIIYICCSKLNAQNFVAFQMSGILSLLRYTLLHLKPLRKSTSSPMYMTTSSRGSVPLGTKR